MFNCKEQEVGRTACGLDMKLREIVEEAETTSFVILDCQLGMT